MLSTREVPIDVLFAAADRAADSLGCRTTSSEHLLLAMLESDAGHGAELLRDEGLDAERIAERVIRDREDPDDGGPPSRTPYLEDIAQIAHEHAVLLESEDISADHVLLAIAVSGKGAAGEVLDELPGGAAGRIASALMEALQAEGLAAAPALTVTSREALALAWSRAHALGAEEIEVADLMHGLSAPGWTIGARAIAALGTPPDWTPTLWTEAEETEPYRRIPPAEATRRVLRRGAEEAAGLGREFTGSEHLLLALSAEAAGDLNAFVARSVTPERVREAVAEAVRGKEEAQDAEARRRGWTPEPRQSFAEIAVAEAKEAVKAGAVTSPVEGGPPPGCWTGLVAAIRLEDDEDLAELLDDMELDPDEIHALAREQVDSSFAVAIKRAEETRPGGELEPVDAIVAAVAADSPRVRSALDELGLTPNEVIAQLSEWRLREGGEGLGTGPVLAASGVNLLLGFVTSIALLEVTISQGAWWKLLFLPLVWSGYPNYGPAGSAVAAAVLGFAVSPLVGGLHLLGIPADLIQAQAERTAVWARTGIRLNLRELRCVTRRALGSMGRVNQAFRQFLRAEIRKLTHRTRRSR